MQDHSLLRLLQLVSPTLPVGAFAYSQGLEYAIEEKWLKDQSSTQDWLSGLLLNNVAQLDLPICIRVYDALEKQDIESLHKWNQIALANRETQELRLETKQLAKALLRLLSDMGEDVSVLKGQDCDWAVAFTYAAYKWDIQIESILLAYLWTWLENQIAAAIKLVPLGQTQGQVLLKQLAEEIPVAISKAQKLEDDEIGALAPCMAIASCKHETQYSRLFRS